MRAGAGRGVDGEFVFEGVDFGLGDVPFENGRDPGWKGPGLGDPHGLRGRALRVLVYLGRDYSTGLGKVSRTNRMKCNEVIHRTMGRFDGIHKSG